jgi:hypothetical protein
MDKENIVDIYLKDLDIIKQPGLHLAKFMWEALGRSPNKDDIIKLSRLVKLYGRYNVFAGLLELIEVDKLDNNYYGLLLYFIKNKVLGKNKNSSENLTDYVKNIKKDINKKKENRRKD